MGGTEGGTENEQQAVVAGQEMGGKEGGQQATGDLL